jgi:branched-chain amino acid transport system permease protein
VEATEQARRAPDVWLDRARAALGHRVAGPVIVAVLGYVLLLEGVLQLAFGRIELGPISVGRYEDTLPRGVFIDGAVIGSLYALVAIGLILVYRANRVINFAQAQLGAVPAVVALLLIALKGWSYWLVVPIVLIGGAALGAGVEVVAVRRFRKAPRLILTVVTIGIGFVLLVAEFAVKVALSDELIETAATTFPTPWASTTWQLGIYTLTGDAVFALVVVAGVCAALAAFFRYTDMGIAVRASAENDDRASLLGIPVARVSTVVWAIAATISAIGIFLRAPLVGLPLTGFTGPAILLYGLAAAVIARMERLPLALGAGVLIGCIDASARFATRRPSLAQAVMLGVILLALLLQRKAMARAYDTGTSSWQVVREIRPIPAELRRLPEVARARLAVALTVGAAVILAPFIVGELSTGRLTQLVLYAMVGVSLVVLTGWSGQISLGQWAIAGIGCAVAGGLIANHGWDLFATLAVAGLAGAGVAVLIGLPALRIQGLFLAVTTLAFAFTVQNLVLSREFFGWLLPEDFAFVERPVLYGVLDMTTPTDLLWFTIGSEAKLYYLCVVFLGLSAAVARSLRNNRSGRVLIGARDNPRLVQAFGVPLARTRLAAFAISGFMAAIAGALFALEQGKVIQGSFPPEQSILLFVMTVIGGMGSITGAILGAVYIVGVPLLPGLRSIDNIELLSSGLGLLVLLYFVPGGLAELLYRGRDTWLRQVAARRGMRVPSLIADGLADDQPTDPLEAAVDDRAATSAVPATDATVDLDAGAEAERLAARVALLEARLAEVDPDPTPDDPRSRNGDGPHPEEDR